MQRIAGAVGRRQDDGDWWIWAICPQHSYARIREDDIHAALLAGKRELAMEPVRARSDMRGMERFARILAGLTPRR
jgi:hypothetical protein